MTWEEMTVRVTTASGFMCRHVFYSVPSRLIGHRLRLRIHDDRIEAYLGGSFLLALPRGRRAKGGRAVHVVDYRHVISALRAKPGALTHLAYRDALWPRAAFRRAWRHSPRPGRHLRLLGPWSACWRSRMTAAWRPTSPWRSMRCSTPASCRSWP
jgi:hypothetical protein